MGLWLGFPIWLVPSPSGLGWVVLAGLATLVGRIGLTDWVGLVDWVRVARWMGRYPITQDNSHPDGVTRQTRITPPIG